MHNYTFRYWDKDLNTWVYVYRDMANDGRWIYTYSAGFFNSLR